MVHVLSDAEFLAAVKHQLSIGLGPTKTTQHREAVGVRAPHPDIQIITLIRDAAAGARAAIRRL